MGGHEALRVRRVPVSRLPDFLWAAGLVVLLGVLIGVYATLAYAIVRL